MGWSGIVRIMKVGLLCTWLYTMATQTDCAKIMLAKPGLDFTVKTEERETLTEAAIMCSYDEECAKILAGVSGVDWSAKMSDGETPTMHCLKNDEEMFEILLKSPLVDLNIKDDDGDTPIIFCLKKKEATSEELQFFWIAPELNSALPSIGLWKRIKWTL